MSDQHEGERGSETAPREEATEPSEKAARPRDTSWLQDFLASMVVFLVALPLCIGIAVACGVPAERGLVSGIIGGIVVGIFAGAPLLVTGPAASLIVPVYDLVQHHGLAALGPVVIMAGGWQILAGVFGLGQWFRAVAPAVIIGMLVGIGLLIFASQLHVAVDNDPASSLVENVVQFPGAVIAHLSGSYPGLCAMGVGIATILLLVSWNRLRPRGLSLVPGHLVALITVSLVTFLFDLPVRFLDISPNFIAALGPVHALDFQGVFEPGLIGKSLIFAFVASAATLLTASAIDQKQNHAETNYNREMLAQGIGNIVTGGVGGLPMTGVIVRSSVNVDAGARTRASAILHGIWILGFVLIMPEVLEKIPRSALGAILVYTGYKLIDVRALQALYKRGRSELLIALITMGGVIFVELFVGVLAGLAASVFKLVYTFSHLKVQRETSADGEVEHLRLNGSATFVRLPQLAEVLAQLPTDRKIVVHIDHLDHIDHACLELLSTFKQKRESRSQAEFIVEWDELTHRYENAVLGVGLRPAGPSGSLLSMVWAEWKRVYGLAPGAEAEIPSTPLPFGSAQLEVRSKCANLDEIAAAAGRLLGGPTGVSPEELSRLLVKRADKHIVLGQGICVPHTPLDNVDKSYAACIVTERPIDIFGEYCDIFFILVAPKSSPDRHLHALAHVGGLCHDSELLGGLRDARNRDEAAMLLRHAAERSEHAEGSGNRERRLAVLESESKDDALRLRELLHTAFQVEPSVVGAQSELFAVLSPLIGAPDTRFLVSHNLPLSDIAVLRALLEEQTRLFPQVFCRLHVLMPEASYRGASQTRPRQVS